MRDDMRETACDLADSIVQHAAEWITEYDPGMAMEARVALLVSALGTALFSAVKEAQERGYVIVGFRQQVEKILDLVVPKGTIWGQDVQ